MITLEKVISEMKSESIGEVICGSTYYYDTTGYDDQGNLHSLVYECDDNDTPEIGSDDTCVLFIDVIIEYALHSDNPSVDDDEFDPFPPAKEDPWYGFTGW
jgi:hypothetical protein